MLLFTSLPDTTGGDGNPPVKVAPLPEDTLRCFAAGYDVVFLQQIIPSGIHSIYNKFFPMS